LLPAYPTEDDPDADRFPDHFRSLFPDFDSYKEWFRRLIGIYGDSVSAQKLLAWAKNHGLKVPNPYTHARAFTYNPSEEQLEQLYDLLEWTWGTREIAFCDPMSGGGSIPFEALRYGLKVHANELNPVASVILRATLDYPARFGPSLVENIRVFGRIWAESVQARLRPFFSDLDEDAIGACYLWARTIACPETGKPVPLSPNWWLRKGSDPIAARLVADPMMDRCQFEIVRGASACRTANPDKGTVKRGTGLSPWTGTAINGAYIKAEAQAGRMGEQLYAIGLKKQGDFLFRSPADPDEMYAEKGRKEADRLWSVWESSGRLPTEARKEGRGGEVDPIV
jgi:adenine-specific DNA methylase